MRNATPTSTTPTTALPGKKNVTDSDKIITSAMG